MAINGIVCGVTLLLTGVICVMALGVLVSFLLLPITACVAVVGRNRCRDCGHRFEPAGPGVDTTVLPCFPWGAHVLNIVVLLLLCLVGPLVLEIRAGAKRPSDMTTGVGLLFAFWLLLWGSLFYHVTLYRRLRQKLANRLIWTVLFVLPGVLVGGLVFSASSPTIKMRRLLAYAHLAPLPPSATGLKVYSWSSPFSGEDFMRFTAEPNDIERFVADSPALRGQKPQRYSDKRMRLKYPTDAAGNTVYRMDANEYVTPRGNVPSWYKEEIRGPARKYKVQPPRDQFPGEVLIDEETNTVYIYLCFS